MAEVTVIIPITEFATDKEKEYFTRAVKSAADAARILVVGSPAALEAAKEVGEGFDTLENLGDTSYPAQVNLGVDNVTTEFFSVLEFDDEITPIWKKNVDIHVESDTLSTFGFLPLTTAVDDESKETFGYINEAFWASSFSDEVGALDLESVQNYISVNVSGGLFRTEEFKALGKLKASMKVVYWYEFLLRALYKGKRIYVIPKVGCHHTVNRKGGLTAANAEKISEKELAWWIDLSGKEYFFPNDRNKQYEE